MPKSITSSPARPFLVHKAVNLGKEVGGEPADALRHLNRERTILDDRLNDLRRFGHGWATGGRTAFMENLAQHNVNSEYRDSIRQGR